MDERIDGKQISFFTDDGLVTFEDLGSALGEFPSWSPDGKKIAFHSNRDGNMEVYILDSDFSNIKRLTSNNVHDMFPCWSPDSTKIAFQSNREGNLDIYIMDVDGTNQVRLTQNTAKDFLPAWYQ